MSVGPWHLLIQNSPFSRQSSYLCSIFWVCLICWWCLASILCISYKVQITPTGLSGFQWNSFLLWYNTCNVGYFIFYLIKRYYLSDFITVCDAKVDHWIAVMAASFLQYKVWFSLAKQEAVIRSSLWKSKDCGGRTKEENRKQRAGQVV